MFGYASSQRRIFEQNFLRSVVVSIVYDPIIVTDYQDIIRTSLLGLFPRFRNKSDASLSIEFRPNEKTPIVNVGESVGGYQLLSEDGLSNLIMDNTSIILNLSGATYKRFEQIIPIITMLSELFTKIEIQAIRRISIRKLNVANFETSDLSTVFYDILTEKISASMIATMPTEENFVQHMVSVSMKEGEYRLNLTYGIPPIQNTQKPIKGIFVEDIDIAQEALLTSEELPAKFLLINQVVYDVFTGINSERFKNEFMKYAE